MTTVVLRPVGGSGTVTGDITGATSVGSALSDNNYASYIRASQSVVFLDSVALPAGAVTKEMRSRVLLSATIADTAIVDIANVLAPPVIDTRSFASPVGATAVENIGPWVPIVLTQAGVDDLHIRLRALNWQSTRFYETALELTYVTRPIVYPTGPGGLVANTNKPTVTWQFSAGTDAVGGQTGYRVKIVNATTFTQPGFNIETSASVVDTGFVAGAATSFNVPNPLIPDSYYAFIKVFQSTNNVQQESLWDRAVFTIAPPGGAPTDMVPVNGGTILTSRPTLDANVAYNLGINYDRQWEFSPVPDFSSGLITVLDSTSVIGSRPFAFPSNLRLAQGIWYGRVKTIDGFGASSPYSSTNVFTVAHAPSTTNRKPTGAKSQLYATTVQVSWIFTDPDANDQQTKYRAQLWKLSDPVGSLQDTGILTSANGFHNFTSLNSTWKDTELRWQVQVWDVDDVSSGMSTEQGFFLRDPATINITSPTNAQVIATPTPTLTWTFSGSGGRTQAQWRMTIRNMTSGVDVVTSDWQNGTATSWQVPIPVIAVGPSYRATLEVMDSMGLTSSITRNFTASYSQPAAPTFTVTSTDYSTEARVTVEWSGATPSGTFVAWRVYRRVNDGAWGLIYETLDSAVRLYDDYYAPSGQDVDYAVVEALTSTGVTIETVYSPQTVLAELNHYMLTCPSNPALNLVLYSVTGESFGDEQEMATVKLLGRGRRVEYGDRFGTDGSLNVSFRDNPTMTAREQRVRLEALRDSGFAVYLLNPFGDVYRVAMMSAQITRVPGTGKHEMATATISYSEITA